MHACCWSILVRSHIHRQGKRPGDVGLMAQVLKGRDEARRVVVDGRLEPLAEVIV